MTTPVKQVKPEKTELSHAPQKAKPKRPEGELRGVNVKRKLDFDSEPVKRYRLLLESEIRIFNHP